MSLILIYNGQTEVSEFNAAFNEYCCIFDEVCGVIINTFHLSNLLSDYRMAFLDPSYGSWINFNVHVTKRITEILRNSILQTLKIRIERNQRNTTASLVEKKTINQVECGATGQTRYAHLTIWLDEHIGHPLYHKQLKQDCRAMINTNTSFTTNDNIDILIQSNSSEYNINPNCWSNPKYLMETSSNNSCPFQCTLFTADNTDKFFEYLSLSFKLTTSLSIIVSEYFARDILPIILSRKQKQLLPQVLFLYVLCTNIDNNYDWAVGYMENNDLSVTPFPEVFNDEKALFVRLVNDVRSHLTLEGDKRRLRKENWHALQYYLAARQLFLNSLPWDSCYTLRELDHLDQLIAELEFNVRETFIKTFRLHTIGDDYDESVDQIAQECAEIVEGI